MTVASDGCLTQDEVEEVTGLRRIELPARIAYGTAERLHRLGMTPAPASELAYTAEPWVVPSTRLRAAGWEPAHDNRSALAALVDERVRPAAPADAGSGATPRSALPVPRSRCSGRRRWSGRSGASAAAARVRAMDGTGAAGAAARRAAVGRRGARSGRRARGRRHRPSSSGPCATWTGAEA